MGSNFVPLQILNSPPFSFILIRSHYPEKKSARDFKDVAASRAGHSHVVLCVFLATEINRDLMSIISRIAH